MTNKETAERLRAIADVIERADVEMTPSFPHVYITSKADLLAIIRSIGGRWTKNYPGWSNDMYLEHPSGFSLSIPRDKVCRKIERWECEPLFSPEDHAEIDAELLPEAEKAAAVE